MTARPTGSRTSILSEFWENADGKGVVQRLIEMTAGSQGLCMGDLEVGRKTGLTAWLGES